MNRRVSPFVALFVSLAWLPVGHGQVYPGVAGPGMVSGSGTVKIEQPASTMRLSIQLTEEGPALKDALAKLKDRREAAVIQLESLGAKSIKLTDAQFAGDQSQQNQRMQQMVMMQLRAQGRKIPKGLKVPESVKVAATLTAEWPLEADDTESLLATVQSLKEKVTAADLAGLKEPKELSPEQEELAEEMEQMMSEYGMMDETEAKPGEPHFVFVGTISEEQRQAAMAAAFKKAHAQAAQLAQAAGAVVGKLSSLSGATTPVDQDEYDMYGRSAYAMRMMMQQMGRGDHDHDELSAVSAQPGPVSLEVIVNATFELK